MSELHDSDDRRNQFINAAEQLFKEHGVVDTTVAAIVKEMNVAKGLFYYYFNSKDDVIEAISQKYNRQMKCSLQKAIDASDDFDERLRSFLTGTMESFRMMWENLDAHRANIDLTLLSSRTIDEAKQTARDSLRELLEEGNRLSKLHVDDPDAYADAIIGGLADLARYTRDGFDEIAKRIEDYLHSMN